MAVLLGGADAWQKEISMSDKLTAKSLRDLASAPDSVAWGGSARQMLLWAADLIDAAEGIRAEVASLKEERDTAKMNESFWKHAHKVDTSGLNAKVDHLTRQLTAANERVERMREALQLAQDHMRLHIPQYKPNCNLFDAVTAVLSDLL